MFLRNYYNLLARCALNLTSDVAYTGYGDSSLSIKTTKGNYISLFDPGEMNYTVYALTDFNIVFSDNNRGIVFGSGNEPVTFEDYKMGTLLTSGLNTSKVSTSNITYDSALHKFNCTSKYTLSNSSNNEIIIREYGFQTERYKYQEGTLAFLIFRDLIEPYALQPSESVNVILNASYTMPTIDQSGNVVAGTQAYGLAIE